MSINSDFFDTTRKLRSTWRDEEENFIADSIEYVQKKMSLLDYLASIAHAGHNIAILTHSYKTEGQLIHIGSDFFSIVSPYKPRYAQSFVVGTQEYPQIDGIEIEVGMQSPAVNSFRLVRHMKSFRSLLDDVSQRDCYVEVETRHENIYRGTIDLYSNFILMKLNSTENSSRTLVQAETVLIPIDGIVSILYSI